MQFDLPESSPGLHSDSGGPDSFAGIGALQTKALRCLSGFLSKYWQIGVFGLLDHSSVHTSNDPQSVQNTDPGDPVPDSVLIGLRVWPRQPAFQSHGLRVWSAS